MTKKRRTKKRTTWWQEYERVQVRRLKWLGQILTMWQDRILLHKVMKNMFNTRWPGDILMDVPVTTNWPELISLVRKDKGTHWKYLVRKINDMVYIQATKGDKKDKVKTKKKINNHNKTTAMVKDSDTDTTGDSCDSNENEIGRKRSNEPNIKRPIPKRL